MKKALSQLSYDAVIIGGGMIGLTTAIRLAQQQRQVLVLERHEQPSLSDDLALRVSALNDRSRQQLRHCGVWSKIQQYRTGPYQRMQVWDKDNCAEIDFSASDVDASDLGAIAENNVVEHFLWQRAEQLGVTLHPSDHWQLYSAGDEQQPAQLSVDNKTITTQLLIGADGGRSKVRQWCELPITFWDYEQQGIVANINTEQPHQGIARQVFLPTGPLALLPTADEHTVSIVWSADQTFAQQLLAETPQRLAKWVETESGRVLGSCRCDSSVKAFPLRMQYAQQWYHQRVVLIGDAAHTIHPLAGQGANLGFGDVQALTDLLADIDWSQARQLQRQLGAYQRQRKAETQLMIAAMEMFKRGFGTSNPVLKGLRALALALPNRLPPLKRQLAAVALGSGQR